MLKLALLTLIAFSLAAPPRGESADLFRPQAGRAAMERAAWIGGTKNQNHGQDARGTKNQSHGQDAHGTIARPANSIISDDGNVPQDIATGDWNGDGIPDLAIAYAYSDEVRWYFGGSHGVFTAGGTRTVGTHPGTLDDLPRRLWAADFDDDGLTDLAVLCSGVPAGSAGLTPTAPSLGILYGAPGGGFEPFQAVALWPEAMNGAPPQYATSLAGAVVDNEGGILLAAGFMDSHQVSLIRHRAGRRWDAPVIRNIATAGPGPVDLALADLDLDGQTDLLALNRKELQLCPGNGTGGFGPATTVATGQALTALALADFDQDGAWDLGVADGTADTLQILMGLDSAGHAQATQRIGFPAGSGPWRLLRLDANMDGRDDLAVLFLLANGGQILLGQNPGAARPLEGAFPFGTAQQPCALVSGHFDRDDLPTLAIVNQGDLSNTANTDLSLINIPALPGQATRLALRSSTDPGLPRTAWLTRPRGLAHDPAQHSLWTLDRRGCKLVKCDESGTPQTVIPLTPLFSTQQVADPTDLDFDAKGDAWITDRLTANVLHLDLRKSGDVRQGFSIATSGLNRPSGIAFDPGRNRLFISDETQPRIAAFSPGGKELATYQLTGGQPLRDLAWNAATGSLWGVPEGAPEQLCELTLNDAAASASVSATLGIASLAPLLAGQTIRSVATEPGGRFWLLTDSGALIQATTAPALVSTIELAPLRRTLAATAEPEGTTLLADGDLRSTLYRLSTSAEAGGAGAGPGGTGTVRIAEQFALRGPQDSPLHIRGLARTASRIYVLDGVAGKVFLFGLHGQPAGSIAIPNLQGRRPQGLYVDPAAQHLWIAVQGRLLEYSAAGAPLGSTPLATTTPPTALGTGRQAGELALLSMEASAIMVRQTAGGEAKSWQKILFQTMLRTKPFQAMSAVPVRSGWELLGADEDAVVLTEQTAPSTAVRTGWGLYE